MNEETAEKGTQENPFDNLQDAYAALDGSGKVLWVYDPDAVGFIKVEEVEEEDNGKE